MTWLYWARFGVLALLVASVTWLAMLAWAHDAED